MQQSIEQPLFETLFSREYRGVLSVARRIVGSAAADDVAQEAFAALFSSGLSDPDHARHWLYRAVVHRALDAVRRDRNRNERERRFPAPAAPSLPDELVERRETAEFVQRALRGLKAQYAAVLCLRHSGLSYKEISQILNVPVERVGILLVRAEAAFKKELTRVSP